MKKIKKHLTATVNFEFYDRLKTDGVNNLILHF